MTNELVGFEDPNSCNENDDQINIKKFKTSKKKGGGFQAMGLSFPVLKGIQKRGYKIPTPIQRKTIPVVLEGRDVVAMARTGSGKTACFLIPLFEKLINSASQPGVRALILSPTRELALQTLKFVKELGRFINLKSAVVLGGDSMDNQFAALHGNPDIIVATPGRFLHICIEMELKLQSVQFIIFDEADRLFEMGFGEQLKEIVKRLPESRQTMLFSATLPKVLVEFAKAGLNEPVLIRLDVETKVPEKLDLFFLCCRSDEKSAALLCVLKYAVESNSQTVVFAATRHHVEYLHLILDQADIPNTYIYSCLDPSARKINAAKFQLGKVPVLLVTDVAARGLDIPQLDYVINYNFPAKPKLFVHRVGRCARAGRHGIAFSLVGSDELAYLIDLHLFLGRPLNIGEEGSSVGSIPSQLLEEEHSQLVSWHNANIEMKNMERVCGNAYKQYLRSRPGASVESVRRVKELDFSNLKTHKQFGIATNTLDENKFEILSKMKRYRPNGTVFEIGHSSSSSIYTVMKTTRAKHRASIAHHKKRQEDKDKIQDTTNRSHISSLPSSSADEIQNTFSDVIAPKRYNVDILYQPSKKKRKVMVDTENFIPYKASDHHTEQGLSVNNFQTEAAKSQFDLTADTEDALKLQRHQMKWDKKKKKMVGVDKNPKAGKIRTESGVWIPASYKTNRYAQWKEKNKVEENDVSDSESGDDNAEDKKKKKAFLNKKFPKTRWGRHNEKLQRKMKSELQRPEQILKKRKELERKRNKSKGKKKRRKQKH